MVEYNYEILRLNVAPHKNGMDNVVVSVNWRYQITENSDYADIYYVTDIPSATDPDSFIAYDSLTDEMVFSWVSKAVDLKALQKELQAELEKRKIPEKVEKLPPWDMSVKYTGDEDYLIVTDNEPNDPLKTFGPMKWNTERANKILVEKTDIDYQFPEDIIMYQKGLLPQGNVPLKINDRMTLYKVEYEEAPDLDAPFEYHKNLQWVIDSGKAVGTYFVFNREVDELKKMFHDALSEKSFAKQNEGVDTTIQSKSIKINSDFVNRSILFYRWSLMADDSSEEFKLNNGEWFTLSKTEVETVLITINNHLKQVMAWESSISSQINNSVTIEDLKTVYDKLIEV